MKQTLKDYKNYILDLDWLQKLLHFSILVIVIVASVLQPIILAIIGVFILLVGIYSFIKNRQFESQAIGNGIIFGGRGKGKGLLLNKRINTDRNKIHFTNIPYNKYSKVINIKEYIDSIKPNTTENFINNNIKIIKKQDKYEGVNIYWDDIGVYAPNYMDYELKKLYPSLSALLPINRHLYDAHMIITVQDIERPYKLLRELQTDFSIKAVSSNGWGYIWRAIPFLSLFSTTKYIYYENTKSAYSGKLPFNAKAIVNETVKHGLLTAGQATKETYNAENGVIKYGRIIQLKRNINYDTRYFHKVVYGKTIREHLESKNLETDIQGNEK